MRLSILKHREHLIVPWLLLIVYFALPSRYTMYDSIRFAQAVEGADLRSYPFWHPSHLFYEPLMYGLYSAAQKIGLPITLFQLCTAQGILSSFLLVYAAGGLLIMHGISSQWAALALSMWAGSYVVWHCTTLPDMSRNLLAILALIGALYVISAGQNKLFKGWPFLGGFLIGLAGLFHTLTVFAVPSLCYFLWKHVKESKKVSVFITIFFVSTATVFSSYAFAIMFLGHVEGIRGFVRWFAAPGGGEWWQSNLPRAGLDFVLTSVRAILGSITYEPLKKAVFSAGADHAPSLLFGLIGATILCYWGFIIISKIIRPSASLSSIGRAMVIWFFSYLPIALFFDKWDVRVLLYLSLPVVLLIAECASHRNLLQHRIAAIVTTLLLFGVNGSTIMHQESKPEAQHAYLLLESMNSLSQDPSDLFLVSTGTDAQYAQYFGKRRALPLRAAESDFSKLKVEMSDIMKTGKRLFIETDLLDRIEKGKHPSSGVLTELVGVDAHWTRGPEAWRFILLQPPASR